MKKIVVLGSAGAGKSTLARHLGALLNIRVTHLDALFWKPGWVMTEGVERAALEVELVRNENWIIDGNYAETLDVRLPEADTIIYLDFSTPRCLYRVLSRWAELRGQQRPDVGPGCPEKLDWEFIRWVMNFRKKTRPGILAAIERHGAGKTVVILKSPRAVRRFLEEAAQLHILGISDPLKKPGARHTRLTVETPRRPDAGTQ